MKWTGILLMLALLGIQSASAKYNVVLMVADDLGSHDLGYVNPDIISPNIDKLANEGVILDNEYVMNVCTPTRHSLMTGRYPFKTEMAHIVLFTMQPHCSPTDIKFMPQYFKDMGYNTYMSGKWHLGMCQEKCLPPNRGFDHFYGYYQGEEDYYTKETGEEPYRGYDFRNGADVDLSANGTFNTYLFSAWLKDKFSNYDSENPFFLYLTWPNVHTPLHVPEKYSSQYPGLSEYVAAYRGLITAMDDGIGQFVEVLKDAGLYEDTLIVFTSDNGGEHGGHALNNPYRGSKGSMFEGGVRARAFAHGTMLKKTGYHHEGLFHAIDWLPTIMGIVENDNFDAKSLNIDGYDQSDMILNGGDSKRQDVVFNIDMAPLPMMGQSAVRVGDWKFIWGCYGATDGHTPNAALFYGDNDLRAGAGLPPYTGVTPDARAAYDFSPQNMQDMTTMCNHYGWTKDDTDNPNTLMYLFNLKDDPYEETNLADNPDYKDQVQKMKNFILDNLDEYVQAPDNQLVLSDPAGDPNNFDGVWTSGWCEDMNLDMV